tara:strand:- start:735 stop:1202 length:468 start_codon:yes stop_codon:yes gene_type:complete
MNIIDEIELEQMKEIAEKREIPEFAPGDVLKVHLKVVEGTRERIQIFEGLCIARSNRAINSTLTVRKISNGEGVERVFPLYSPLIEKFEVVRRGDVRRAKLYYIRGRSGKKARITEKRMDNKVDISPTKSVKEDAKVKEKDASQDTSSKETVDKK